MKALVIDIDGVMTDGTMHYTAEGKVMKVFGPDDADALGLIRNKIHIHFVSADRRGFPISERRIKDMGYPIDLVPMAERADWIDKKFGLKDTIYIGDGVLDPLVFSHVGYSICPSDGFYKTRGVADYVTKSPGGHRAVAEACIHIMEKGFV
jgi:3-deoxy-D-manno-octulosonate 8-phosphate phosphatase (KDO 8-P phosphatase)